MKQFETLAVNLDKAEFIISLSSKKNSSKAVLTLLSELQDQYAARQKQNRAFYQVSQVILGLYEKKIYASKQLSHRIQIDLHQHELDMNHMTHRRSSLKQDLDEFEAELSETREYAEQRRNKKSKREKQYHQLYHVPLVATQYKKKYVRARDKNSAAENQVSSVREKVEQCSQEITNLSKSVVELQNTRESLVLQSKEINTQLEIDHELVFQVQEANKFLSSFDKHQLATAQLVTTQFMEAVQRNNITEQLVKTFKMALYEYGEAEQVADQRWGSSSLQAEFQCSKCKVVQMGWPKPDKVRTNEVLCDHCYQEHHTSMVFEKKMTGIKDRSSQLLSLPGSSMLSFSSISTTDSSRSSIVTNGSPKPGLKKMMKLFKRNSSSSSN